MTAISSHRSFHLEPNHRYTQCWMKRQHLTPSFLLDLIFRISLMLTFLGLTFLDLEGHGVEKSLKYIYETIRNARQHKKLGGCHPYFVICYGVD